MKQEEREHEETYGDKGMRSLCDINRSNISAVKCWHVSDKKLANMEERKPTDELYEIFYGCFFKVGGNFDPF